MFLRLLLLFISIPLVELILFLVLGARIGVPTTIAIVILTGFLGAALTRSQGLRAIANYRQATREGRLPAREVLDGVLILVAGAVLLTPGFLTDAIGFSLLLPPVRDLIATWAREAFSVRVTGAKEAAAKSSGESRPVNDAKVITIEAEVVEDRPAADKTHS